MGFSSIDDFISEMSSGKNWRSDFMKIFTGGTVVAGRWYDLTYFGGSPAQYTHGNMVSNGDFLAGYMGWTLSNVADWTYTPATHLMTRVNNASIATLTQNTKCVRGRSYSVVYTIAAYAGSGNVTISLGGTAGSNRTANGTYRETIVCGATANAPCVITVPAAVTALTVDVVAINEDLAFIPYTDSQDCALWHGGNVAGDTKHAINFGAWTNSTTGVPGVLMLVDMLGVYPRFRTDLSSTQTLLFPDLAYNGTFTGASTGWTLGSNWTYNANAIDRASAANTATLSQTLPHVVGVPYTITYTISNISGGGSITVSLGGSNGTERTANGTYTDVLTPTTTGDLAFTPTSGNVACTIDTVSVKPGFPRYVNGKGVRAFFSLDVSNGANAQNFAMSYTNTVPASGRSLGATVANTASAIQSHIPYSGVAAGNYGPFLPLSAGDAGITSIDSCIFSAASASAGIANLVVCRPIASLPITTTYVAAERDLMNQLPSLPRIYDGACLGFLFFAGAVIASGSQWQGYIDSAWG